MNYFVVLLVPVLSALVPLCVAIESWIAVVRGLITGRVAYGEYHAERSTAPKDFLMLTAVHGVVAAVFSIAAAALLAMLFKV